MAIVELYSKRQRKLRGELPDVYQYTVFPDPFRIQVVHILTDALGKSTVSFAISQNHKYIYDTLCREYGLLELKRPKSINLINDIFYFFLETPEPEIVLDVIELSFRMVNYIKNDHDNKYQYQAERLIDAEEAISELNQRFLEHGIGYQFESDQIIKVDSKYEHAEIVKPALLVLTEKRYAGANDEFLSAHEHYRHGNYKECLNDCLKSFESVMKIICDKRKWEYNKNDPAKKLISVCFENKLIPEYLESQFNSIRSILESGIPTIRNKLSGHGQGQDQVEVPFEFARYMLNMTGTTILFLNDLDNILK